jgi:hypothetical protein
LISITTTALAVSAVADLDTYDPAPSLEASLDRCAERSVNGIQQPIELGSVPDRPHIQAGSQRPEDRVEHAEAQRRCATALEHRDGSPAHPGPRSERLLRETFPDAKHPGDPAEPLYVHAAHGP